jgi:hypothetical protein
MAAISAQMLVIEKWQNFDRPFGVRAQELTIHHGIRLSLENIGSGGISGMSLTPGRRAQGAACQESATARLSLRGYSARQILFNYRIQVD